MTGETLKSTELRSLLNHQTHQLYERAIAEATIGCQKQSRRMWEEYVVFLKSLKPPGNVQMALENMLKVLCNFAFSISDRLNLLFFFCSNTLIWTFGC